MASHDESTTLELQAATTDRPSLTSHRAADKALSTNELLCGIISHLPFNDIVAATRVCRIWRDTLVADPNIQETLFLRPTEIREVIPIDHVELPDAPVPIEDCSIIGNLNPWLFKICGPVRTAGLYPGGDDDIRPGSTRPELSCDGLWRQMFVTQPPCKSITVSCWCSLSEGQYYTWGPTLNFKRQSGIKMGELYDFINEGMSNHLTGVKYYHPRISGSWTQINRFETEEYITQNKCRGAEFGNPWNLTRFQLRDGVVCGPAQSSPRPSPKDSDSSKDPGSSADAADLDDSDPDHQLRWNHDPHGAVAY
jgi:hypothetical protein